MTTNVALAFGEVPWEREILHSISAHPRLQITRRYVDVHALLADMKQGALAPAVLMSPALRGFDEKPVLELARTGVHVVVVLDTIRPPWLSGSSLDCRERSQLLVPSLLEEIEQIGEPVCVSQGSNTPTGELTVFAGVSGGVGVTSLLWISALRAADALVVDANVAAPMLGFLCGADAASAALREAVLAVGNGRQTDLASVAWQRRFLTLPLGGDRELDERDATALAEAAGTQFARVMVDAGAVGSSPFGDALINRAEHLVLVATAAPSGVLRIPGALAQCRRDDLRITVVVNQFRTSVADSRRARSAIRGLVERSCALTPIVLDDDREGFDRAWLDADWRTLTKAVPDLMV